MTRIEYRRGNDVEINQALEVYRESGLGERRPIDDPGRFADMIRNANLFFTAWDGEEMVGLARSITDWVYVTYLSDLAVKRSHQKLGIGKELIRLTRSAVHPKAMLLLLAAPAAVEYYPRIGFRHHPQAWFQQDSE